MRSVLVFSLFNKTEPVQFLLLAGETLEELYPKYINEMRSINKYDFVYPPFEEVLVVNNCNKTEQIRGEDCFEDIMEKGAKQPYQIYIVFPEKQTKSVIYAVLNQEKVDFAESYNPDINVIVFLNSLLSLRLVNLQACYIKINGQRRIFREIVKKTLIQAIDQMGGCKIVCFDIVEGASQRQMRLERAAKDNRNSVNIFIEFEAENGNNFSLKCKQSVLNLEKTLMSQLPSILHELREEGFDWPYSVQDQAIYLDKLKIIINKSEYRQYKQKLGVSFKPGQIQSLKIQRVYEGG